MLRSHPGGKAVGISGCGCCECVVYVQQDLQAYVRLSCGKARGRLCKIACRLVDEFGAERWNEGL
jgi:hypothetical protein